MVSLEFNDLIAKYSLELWNYGNGCLRPLIFSNQC